MPRSSRSDLERLTIPEPMLARTGTGLPEGDNWVFEPKYDGVRVLALATASGARLVTRNGAEKGEQFPEVVAALQALARRRRRTLLLDGELVALVRGRPARFQHLQRRVHLEDTAEVTRRSRAAPAGLVVFDLLLVGDRWLLDEPWTVRRAELDRALAGPTRPGGTLRPGGYATSGRSMLAAARRAAWEGVMAKRADARYEPGRRSKAWLKLKLEHRQEFVIGGFTEPRRTRPHLGALLLGYYDSAGRFVYAGHTGGGFTHAGLAEMRRRLQALERPTSPFVDPPRTNEAAHWVEPRIVVEVRFNEWTADGRLRQPIYLGTRDDKNPREVTREGESMQRAAG